MTEQPNQDTQGPQCQEDQSAKDVPGGHNWHNSQMNRRQLRSIRKESNFNECYFNRKEDVMLRGQNTTLTKLTMYCQENQIPYHSIYARIGGYCMYAFQVVDQSDVEYAIQTSQTEGYLCWIMACKESAEEFERETTKND